MSNASPMYRIRYQHCQEKGHETEKTNLVCLSKSCEQHSLICSLCLQQNHKGHRVKPLKHFLQNLQKKYCQDKESTVNADLEQLENSKYFLLNKVKQVVQILANKFMALQKQILDQYQLIKAQILDKEIKRNKFSRFYHSMAIEGKGDPNFQIRDYLYFQPLCSFNLTNDFDIFLAEAEKNFTQIHKNIIIKKKDHLVVEENTLNLQSLDIPKSNQTFCLAKSIKQVGNTFTQTNFNTDQTVGYLNVVLKDIKGKIRVKVLTLKQNALLTFGIADLKQIINANFCQPKSNAINVFSFDSKGKSIGANYNYIKSITTGTMLDFLIKKHHCKISSKSNFCDFTLPDKDHSVIFFSLKGQCQIQITYPFVKN